MSLIIYHQNKLMADRNFTNTEGKYVYLTQQKKFFVSPDLHFAFASVGNSVDTEHPLFLSLLTAIKTNLEIAEFSKSDIFEIELNKAFKNMTIIVMTRRNVYILDVEENDNCENPKSVMYRKHLDNLLSYGTGCKIPILMKAIGKPIEDSFKYAQRYNYEFATTEFDQIEQKKLRVIPKPKKVIPPKQEETPIVAANKKKQPGTINVVS